MKRWIPFTAGLCAVVVLLMALAMPATATDAYDYKDDWKTYVLWADKDDSPHEGEAPAAVFTENGYGVTSGQGISQYSLGTTKPIASLDGFYMEVEIEQIQLSNILVLAIWNRDRMIAGYHHYGSGWHATIPLVSRDTKTVMSTVISENRTDECHYYGDVIVDNIVKDSDTLTFVLEITEAGEIRVNGVIVEGSAEAMAFLRAQGSEQWYVSATLMAAGSGDTTSPMMLTRFGAKEGTAYVPGVTPPPSETGNREPVETFPLPDGPFEDSGEVTTATATDKPADDSSGDSTRQEDAPVATGKPVDDSPDAPSKDPEIDSAIYAEPETTDELAYYADLYKKAGGCGSVVGSAVLCSLVTLAAAAYILRHRKRC